jgi:hypothetical protein
MRDRIVPTIVSIAIALYCVIFLYVRGFELLFTDLIFGLITTSVVFLLPALLSKTIFKKSYFGVGYILSTLIYPLIYLTVYLLHRFAGIDAQLIYHITASLILAIFVYGLLIHSYAIKKVDARKISKAILLYLFVILAVFGTYKILGIQNSSILSLDFLQHNAVSVQMSDGQACLTPNDCSSLFKKLGYTTYYHTIQTVITEGFNIEIGLAEVVSRLAFIGTSALVIFSLIQKQIKDDELALAGMLIAIFTFELGSYSFNFFIPQTLVLLFFLSLLNESHLSWKKLLLVSPILLMTHFIFGPFFFVLISIYLLFFNKKPITQQLGRTISLLMFLAIIVSLVANWRGFSIERVLQQADVEQLGFYTNYYFPENLVYLLKQYGFLIAFGLVGLVYALGRKKITPILLYSVVYISIGLTCYFLAPTYANKFLLGSSVFLSMLITFYISKLNIKRPYGFIVLMFIFFSTLPFYLNGYSQYTTFYTQNDGSISAITNEDRVLVNRLKEENLNCKLMSDPLTQLVIQSQIPIDTAGGQYQELQTRKDYLDFIQNPNEDTYSKLTTNPEVGENICILITPRIYSYNRYLSIDQISWLNSMYEYEINNNYQFELTKETKTFLESKGYKTTVLPSNNYLFSRE